MALKRGHFYLAENRTFLLCVDRKMRRCADGRAEPRRPNAHGDRELVVSFRQNAEQRPLVAFPQALDERHSFRPCATLAHAKRQSANFASASPLPRSESIVNSKIETAFK